MSLAAHYSFVLQELKGLIDEFVHYLKLVPKDNPLVLLFDSLDQLDTADGARQLDWLPRKLPRNVKMILSTLPDDKYGCLPRCRVSQHINTNISRTILSDKSPVVV